MIELSRKEHILQDAKQRILEGHTLAQIAVSHDIGLRTLETWLHQLGDDYTELRQAWIDNMLLDAGEEIDRSVRPFVSSVTGTTIADENGKLIEMVDEKRLALAREKWKKATWYAERRDAQRYGQKVEHKQDLSLSITVNRSLPDNSKEGVVYEHVTEELRNLPLKPA